MIKITRVMLLCWAAPVYSLSALSTEAIDHDAMGLRLQIEDDLLFNEDSTLKSIQTEGCNSVITVNMKPKADDYEAPAVAATEGVAGPTEASNFKLVQETGEVLVGEYQVDWAKAEAAVMQYNFIYIRAPGVKIALVGDGESKQELSKMETLATAMLAKMVSCQNDGV
jgi:hypothetical protein